ncbi:MAG: hypothetical protein HC869_25685 [Rhodospirillales bacterium]|nr:hypothetical protein [Rhodospirillales bacterium]
MIGLVFVAVEQVRRAQEQRVVEQRPVSFADGLQPLDNFRWWQMESNAGLLSP